MEKKEKEAKRREREARYFDYFRCSGTSPLLSHPSANQVWLDVSRCLWDVDDDPILHAPPASASASTSTSTSASSPSTPASLITHRDMARENVRRICIAVLAENDKDVDERGGSVHHIHYYQGMHDLVVQMLKMETNGRCVLNEQCDGVEREAFWCESGEESGSGQTEKGEGVQKESGEKEGKEEAKAREHPNKKAKVMSFVPVRAGHRTQNRGENKGGPSSLPNTALRPLVAVCDRAHLILTTGLQYACGKDFSPALFLFELIDTLLAVHSPRSLLLLRGINLRDERGQAVTKRLTHSTLSKRGEKELQRWMAAAEQQAGGRMRAQLRPVFSLPWLITWFSHRVDDNEVLSYLFAAFTSDAEENCQAFDVYGRRILVSPLPLYLTACLIDRLYEGVSARCAEMCQAEYGHGGVDDADALTSGRMGIAKGLLQEGEWSTRLVYGEKVDSAIVHSFYQKGIDFPLDEWKKLVGEAKKLEKTVSFSTLLSFAAEEKAKEDMADTRAREKEEKGGSAEKEEGQTVLFRSIADQPSRPSLLQRFALSLRPWRFVERRAEAWWAQNGG
eukprot:CAMPEP_0113918628 /NCGR_PEP_ID=MMETSP0780_2-20120614/33468_1 /TAXON_ID=652834 /ORGANISM="Palpitomonas bilix" /LENGTH=562 /DNA_ID=CAMNT_0000918479 /DNA_START=231 /DNA_END=1916 /DNA_ORIENTATION=- /assembly_acc=CAM_ASM_000599